MTAGALEFSFVSSFLSIASITCAVICLLGGVLGFVYFFFPGFIVNGMNTVNAKRARLRKHSLHAAGFTWNYYSGGKHNGQLVLLVHGFSASKDGLTILARYLAPYYRVVIPDLPGHGDTVPSDPKADYTIRTQVTRLNQFMDTYLDNHQLPRTTKFHIAGISMGGLISGFFSTKHHERLLSTTLMCPAGILGEKKSRLISNYESGEGNALLPVSIEGAKKMIEMVFHKPPKIPENLLKYSFSIREKRHEVYTKIMGDILAEPLLLQHSLHDIKTPTLIIWGENDSIIDISCVDVLKGGLKCYYKVAVLEQAGHSITLEAPDRCGHHILEFLNNPHKWIVEHTQNAQETVTALETSDTEGADQQSADEEEAKGSDSQQKVLRKRRSKRAE